MTAADAPRIVLLEAPSGYGKTWLLHQVKPAETLWLRARLEHDENGQFDDADCVVVDDAHLLDDDDTYYLVDHIINRRSVARLFIAGRLVDDRLHEAVRIANGLVLDTTYLAVTATEVTEHLHADDANELVEVTAGCVHAIATAVEHYMRDPSTEPISVAARLTRSSALTSLRRLNHHDQGFVALLARSPVMPRATFDRLADDNFLSRTIDAGVPVARHVTGDLELVVSAPFRHLPVEPISAVAMATEIVQSDGPIKAIGLLLDANATDQAAELLIDLSESIGETTDPRQLLTILARVGNAIEQEPALLLLRATAQRYLGQLDLASRDIFAALRVAGDLAPDTRHRVEAEAARAHFTEGRSAVGAQLAHRCLHDLGPHEGRTFARIHYVLGDILGTSYDRDDLLRAAEHHRVAATAWDHCGEHVHARGVRRVLASVVMCLLGQIEDAITMLVDLSEQPDLTDTETGWLAASHGFAVLTVGRANAADALFTRANESGHRLDNPRMIAVAAWGQALVAACRNDLTRTLAWVRTAENTALGQVDDVLGVPFLCDVSTYVGGLGDLDFAWRCARAAQSRRPLFHDRVELATFIARARCGVVGDVDVQIQRTPPAERWRVYLVVAHATARQGDLVQARQSLVDSDSERTTLGLPSPDHLGEQRTLAELREMLARTSTTSLPPSDTSAPFSPATVQQLQIGLLGALEVNGGVDVVDVGPRQRRSVLAVLLASSNRVVSTDRLLDAIWGRTPTPGASNTLQAHMSRLRKAIGADRITRHGQGYMLRVNVDEFDVTRFEQLAQHARVDLDDGNIRAAHQQLCDALGLWRGDAYQDFAYDDWAQAEIARLTEHRLMVLETRIDIDLVDDRAADLVAELQMLHRQHPLRERFCAQLMIALYRAARQTEAIATYRVHRTRLVDETGLEPSPEIQRLHLQILNHDQQLATIHRVSAASKSA